VTYRAPPISVATFAVTLVARAASKNYAKEAASERVLTVIRPDLPALRVRVDFPAGDLATPTVPLPVTVRVTDLSGGVIRDATVELRVLPEGGASRRNGSSQEMDALTVALPAAGTYLIAVDASKPGYLAASAVATIRAVEPEAAVRPPPPAETDGAGAFLMGMSAAIGATVVACAFALWRSSRNRRIRMRT